VSTNGNVANEDTHLAARMRETVATTANTVLAGLSGRHTPMNRTPVLIDYSLVGAGILFAERRDRNRYLGKSAKEQSRWLKENPTKWRYVRDVEQEAAQLAPLVESEINVEPVPAGPNYQTSSSEVRKNPCAADVVAMLQTAYPKTWEKLLHISLGDTAPAALPPAEFGRFTDHVFWLVKQAGIKNPPAWLAYRAQLEAAVAPAAPVELKSPVEIGDIPVQRHSAELEPVKLGKDSVKTSSVSPPKPVTATVAIGTTKAEVLSRAKVAIEAGESPRDSAERLASVQENFRATQREIAEAVGRSAGWVNRLLKWRRSGYEEYSPFGPTTTAGRVARAQQRTKASMPRDPEATTTTTSADADVEQLRGR
jgi:hypothetical protein